MKEIKPEQPNELLTQIANCNDVLAHMPADGEADPAWLDIKIFTSHCGSHRCWLGDYCMRNHGELNFWCGEAYAVSEFGGDIYSPVFTDEADHPTAFRKAALQSHRDSLQAKVDAWYAERLAGELVS